MKKDTYSYNYLTKNGDIVKGSVASCASCHTKPFLERSEGFRKNTYRYRFSCPSCGKHTTTQKTAQDAKAVWNKRQSTKRTTKFIDSYGSATLLAGFAILALMDAIITQLLHH